MKKLNETLERLNEALRLDLLLLELEASVGLMDGLPVANEEVAANE